MTAVFNRNRLQGMTLIEITIAIVIVGVAFAGLMVAYSSMIGRSADPLIYQQSIAIANSYMEEIEAKPYPGDCTTAYSGTCPAPPADRASYDDICDYDGFDETNLKDIAGNDIAIDGYRVQVDISAAGGDLGISANDAVKIEVTVTHPLGSDMSLTSYRANYRTCP